VGTQPKTLAILKHYRTHIRAKHEKGVGTTFPRISAPLHPWSLNTLNKPEWRYVDYGTILA